MSDPKQNPDVWDALFNQTPIVIRWALGVLTVGVFTVMGVLYRWHRADIADMQRRQERNNTDTNHRIERLESKLDHSMETMNTHLFEIVKNTRRSGGGDDNVDR